MSLHNIESCHFISLDFMRCHTRFLCQNHVLIIYAEDQLFHTYRLKVFTDNQMSRIKYIYYMNNASND
jgi:hypothetical protein